MMKAEERTLKRLGPVPFWRGETKCLEALRRMYARAAEAARRRLEGETRSSAGGA